MGSGIGEWRYVCSGMGYVCSGMGEWRYVVSGMGEWIYVVSGYSIVWNVKLLKNGHV